MSGAGNRQRRAGRRSRSVRKPASDQSFYRRHRSALILLVLALIALAFVEGRSRIDDAITEVTLPLRHDDIIRQQAEEKDVPADLIAAVIYQESRFRDQTSSAGARGLMQITPSTAEYVEDLSGGSTFDQSDLADPDLNIRYGTFYLRHLLDQFEGDEVAALAAYNAGETNVFEWGGSDLEISDIPFPETKHYVQVVLEKRDAYRREYSKELGL